MFQINNRIIPIMCCFDNNYAIAASVAFVSMLKNSNKNYYYKLYVLHSDITEENQIILRNIVGQFDNASLEFIDMNNKFEDLFSDTVTKGHYTKEMYYKFLAPSIFLQYSYMIITDVDVVYCGDVSKEFLKFIEDKENYIAAVKAPIKKDSWLENIIKNNYTDFDENEKKDLFNCAGYLIFNLEKMRQDNCQEKFITFAKKNIKRLKQPEQDTINLVCASKIRFLPLKSLVCSYLYDLYQNESDFDDDLIYTKEELEDAMKNPVQLHFATNIKPWNNPTIKKSEIWYEYLLKTPFWAKVMNDIYERVPDSRYLLFNFLKVLKIKNGQFKIFKIFNLRKKV